MKCNMIAWFGVLAGVGAVAATLSIAIAEDIGCGYVVNRSCPGCTASSPADSSCFCGPNIDECDCVKESGGIQSGEIVTCETGAFDWTPAEHGVTISVGPYALCMKIKKCRAPGGGQHNCLTLDQGVCVPPPPGGNCSWVEWADWYGITYVGGNRC